MFVNFSHSEFTIGFDYHLRCNDIRINSFAMWLQISIWYHYGNIYLPIYTSLFISIYIPVYPGQSISTRLSRSVHIYPSIQVSPYLPIYPNQFISRYLSLFPSISVYNEHIRSEFNVSVLIDSLRFENVFMIKEVFLPNKI